MNTYQEMMTHVNTYKLGYGISKFWTKRHFQVIEGQLFRNETVLTCFIGVLNQQEKRKNEHRNQEFTSGGFHAVAVTETRFIIAKKTLFGERVIIVLRSNLNDVTKVTGALFGTIIFDTIKETFDIRVLKKQINNIYLQVTDVLFRAKKSEQPTQMLLNLKRLYDQNIINEEEYNEKRAKYIKEL